MTVEGGGGGGGGAVESGVLTHEAFEGGDGEIREIRTSALRFRLKHVKCE